VVSPAEQLLVHARTHPARLGPSRLVAIDGPSGSGKTTIAAEIAHLAGARTVHTDDLCPGWDGLAELPRILAALLSPLADGRPGRHPRYDWILGRPAEDVVVEPSELLVLEGVGAGARSLGAFTTTLVWVDAEPELRRHRALERDGGSFAGHWESWARAEAAYFATDQVRERAHAAVWTS
jgi:uridine kinase